MIIPVICRIKFGAPVPENFGNNLSMEHHLPNSKNNRRPNLAIFVRMTKPLVLLFLSVILLIACQKNSGPGGNSRLYFSADTIRFDTVFTSTGIRNTAS